MKPRSLLVGFAVVAVGAGLACAAIFEDPVQCKSDADCYRFDNARCDTEQGVCISRTLGESDSSVAPTADAGGGDGGGDLPDALSDVPVGPNCADPNKPTEALAGNAFDPGMVNYA